MVDYRRFAPESVPAMMPKRILALFLFLLVLLRARRAQGTEPRR
jgi:hypothetical protein